MIKRLLFILFFIFISDYALADIDLSQKVSIADGIIISLPGDWVRIPKEVLEEAKAKIAQLNPKGPSADFDFDYAFQPKYFSRWFTYPYIIIKIKDSGRVPEAQIEKMKNLKSLMTKGLEKVNNDFSKILTSSNVDEAFYDSENHILWSYATTDFPSLGRIKNVTATILTEQGHIDVMEYAKESDFKDFLPFFQKIAKQVILSEQLKYKPRMVDSVPFVSAINWMEIRNSAIGGAVIGGIIGLIFMRKRHLRRESPGRDPVLGQEIVKLKISVLLKDAFNISVKYPELFILGAIAESPTLFMGTKMDLKLLLSVIVSFLLGTYCTGLIIRFIYESREYSPSWLEINKFVLRKYVSLLMLFMLMYVITMVGLVLLIIPGILCAVRLSLSDYGLLLEEDQIIPSIKRSWAVTKGNWWRICFLCLIACLPSFIFLPFAGLIPKPIYKLFFFLLGSFTFVWAQALIFHVYMALRKPLVNGISG